MISKILHLLRADLVIRCSVQFF